MSPLGKVLAIGGLDYRLNSVNQSQFRGQPGARKPIEVWCHDGLVTCLYRGVQSGLWWASWALRRATPEEAVLVWLERRQEACASELSKQEGLLIMKLRKALDSRYALERFRQELGGR